MKRTYDLMQELARNVESTPTIDTEFAKSVKDNHADFQNHLETVQTLFKVELVDLEAKIEEYTEKTHTKLGFENAEPKTIRKKIRQELAELDDEINQVKRQIEEASIFMTHENSLTHRDKLHESCRKWRCRKQYLQIAELQKVRDQCDVLLSRQKQWHASRELLLKHAHDVKENWNDVIEDFV